MTGSTSEKQICFDRSLNKEAITALAFKSQHIALCFPPADIPLDSLDHQTNFPAAKSAYTQTAQLVSAPSWLPSNLLLVPVTL